MEWKKIARNGVVNRTVRNLYVYIHLTRESNGNKTKIASRYALEAIKTY